MLCLAQNSTDFSKVRFRNVQVCIPSLSSCACGTVEKSAAIRAPVAKYVRSKCILISVEVLPIEEESTCWSSTEKRLRIGGIIQYDGCDTGGTISRIYAVNEQSEIT